MKTISLSDYRDILLAHEGDYRQSKGGDRLGVMEKIIEDIMSQGKGKDKLQPEFIKNLESVSQPFYQLNPRSHPLEPRKSKTGTTTTRMYH